MMPSWEIFYFNIFIIMHAARDSIKYLPFEKTNKQNTSQKIIKQLKAATFYLQ